jgi:predicted CXXCH cytochrome family protein
MRRPHAVTTTASLRDRCALVVLGLSLSFAPSAAAFNGAYQPGTGINGTVHDLSTAHNGMNFVGAPTDGQQRVCVFCHAPHTTAELSVANGGATTRRGSQARDAFDYLPLWNHEPTAGSAAFTMYQNGSGAPTRGPHASQAIAAGMAPGSSSLLCLSCHDGSVAVNTYGNVAQLADNGGGARITGPYLIGSGNYLGNHHPIGFNYDAVQVSDREIRPADSATLGAAGTVREHLLGPGNTQMECGTCHSMHNMGNTGEQLLWRSDEKSQLCLTCHDKGFYFAAATP